MSKIHQLVDLPEHRFEFTPEEEELVREVWDIVKAKLGTGDLLSRFARWIFQKTPTYTSRPDLRFHNTHLGYIYVIRDPRILHEKNIIFVGSSNEPWIAVKKNLMRSTNPRMYQYAHQMMGELRLKGYVFWREREVVDSYEDGTPLKPSILGGIEIPWEVVGVYMNPEEYRRGLQQLSDQGISTEDAEPNWSRNEWVDFFFAEGHPIQNIRPGRKSTIRLRARKEVL